MSDAQPSSESQESRKIENVTIPELTKEIVDALAEKGFKPEDLKQNKLAREILNLIIRETIKNPSIEVTSTYVKDAVSRVLNSPVRQIKRP